MRLSFNSCCIRLRFRALNSPFCSNIETSLSLLFFSICIFTFNVDAASFSHVTDRFWQPPRGKFTKAGSGNDNLGIFAAFRVWSALLPILTRFLLWLEEHFFGLGWECGFWDDDCWVPCSRAVRRCVLKYEIRYYSRKKWLRYGTVPVQVQKYPYAVTCFLKCSKALLWTRICFNADLDPAFYLHADPDPGSQTNADPDPGQTLKSQKVKFLHEKIYGTVFKVQVKNIPRNGKKPFWKAGIQVWLWSNSMLLDPDPHSQCGSGSRTAK